MLPDQQHIQGYSSQQMSNNSAQQGGSSYINFNLSTIFPEINVPGPTPPVPPVSVADKIAALLPTVPSSLAPTSARASTSTSLPPLLPPIPPPTLPPVSGVTSTDFRSIPSTTQDILPPSIAIFQHPTTHQMNFGSFSASTFSSSTSASATTPNNFSLN